MKSNYDLGVEISQRLRWDGEAIVETFRAALEDANLHTFNAAVGAVWEMQRKLYDTLEDTVAFPPPPRGSGNE